MLCRTLNLPTSWTRITKALAALPLAALLALGIFQWPKVAQTQAFETESERQVVSAISCAAFFAFLGLLIVLSVLMKQRRATAALKESESLVRGLAETIPQIVWTTNAEGSNDYFSSQWHEYTGQTPEESRGWGWSKCVHAEDLSRATTAWRTAVKESTPYDVEFRIRARDGSYRWFLTRANPLREGTGKVVRWFGTCTDIEQKKRRERELMILAEAGRILTEAADENAMLRKTAQIGIPELADWCQIDLCDADGNIVMAAIAHVDPQKDALAQQFVSCVRLDPDARLGQAEVLRTGRAQIFKRTTPETLEILAPSFSNRGIYTLMGLHSMMIVPLSVSGRIIGTLSYMYSTSGHEYASEDLAFVEELARHIVSALESARLYARERRASLAFQDAALPKTLPKALGLTFSAMYQAAKSEARVGGDWYDAFLLSDGCIVVSIGDVIGSGLPAAVTMGAVRQAIRGAAQIDADPVHILDAVDRVLRSEQPERIVTAFIGVLDPRTRILVYASAGHPAPMLRWDDGTIIELRGSGLPLGLRTDGGRPPEELESIFIRQPALLVLYTDGLTEATRDIEKGESMLREAMNSQGVLRAADQAQAIGSRMGSSLQDDVAILAVRIDSSWLRASVRYEPSRIRWVFKATDSIAGPSARRELAAALRAWNISEAEIATSEVLFSELVGNVARHTNGEVEVSLDFSSKVPVLDVYDYGDGFSYAAGLPKDVMSESGRGLYIVSKLARDLSVAMRSAGGSHARAVLPFELPNGVSALELVSRNELV